MSSGRSGPRDAAVSIAVVLPTRNRADLAEQALQSCIGGGPPGLSIVVSDNSTDAAQAERLRQVVAGLAADAEVDVQYVRPPRDLPMSEHWGWARLQAAQHAASTHVLYLTDRTVLKPGALSRLTEAAAAHPDLVITYSSDLVDDAANPVRLFREPWSGGAFLVPAATLAVLASRLILAKPLPRLLNSLVPTRVLEQMVKADDQLFRTVAPDFRFCFRYLALGRPVVILDEPIAVMHGLQRSNGATTARGLLSKDAEDFQRRSGSGAAVSSLLPGVITNYNIIASEYVAAATDAGAGSLPALDRHAYVRSLAQETDVAAPGTLRDANAAALAAEGVRFGASAARARSAARAWCYLRTLGVGDFVLQSLLRVRSARATAFDTAPEALARACAGAAPRRSSASHLRLLSATPTVTRAGSRPAAQDTVAELGDQRAP